MQRIVGCYIAQKEGDRSGESIRAFCQATPELEELCVRLLPWRTGPYHLGDYFIDSEWQSHMKWSRVKGLIPNRPGLRIADVGCSNGYFLFKLSEFKPEIAVGFDPIERCWLQAALLHKLLAIPNTAFLPLGLASLDSFPRFFDLILCMGVLYHQRDQLAAVRRLYDALRPGGTVVLESLVVNQDAPLLITPPDRYAKMRNAWTIPSASLMKRLLLEVGFSDVQVHTFGPLTTTEQRRTSLAPYESLADFLDANDSSKTIEGHPAPHTAAVVGVKR
jgi:tRNA (mo5U34)-methyltransferase